MMRDLLFTLFLAFAAGANAQNRQLNNLTVDGKTLTNVIVKEVEPDGLRVVHDGGVAKIKIESLSQSMRDEFGLTQLHADAFRAKVKGAKNERISKERAEAQQRQEAMEEKARLKNLEYTYIVLKVERVMPNGDLLCYRHQDGGAVGSAGLALNTIRRRVDRETHVQAYTEYDKPFYVTGVPRQFGEGEIIRGHAARAGVKNLDGRSYVWLVAKPN